MKEVIGHLNWLKIAMLQERDNLKEFKKCREEVEELLKGFLPIAKEIYKSLKKAA